MKITKSHLKKIIEEEIKEQLGGELTPEQERVSQLCYDLSDAVHAMGPSNPELTDDYVSVLRAFQEAGVNLERLIMLA
jgi:hypothetical protein|tara:strand:+ start:711 stop:944 length:234 start_codon:yes stop_codon:yes gene_type:complete